jgi:hypothetical protein
MENQQRDLGDNIRDCIKKNVCENPDKIDMALEKAKWPTLLNTTMNVHVP